MLQYSVSTINNSGIKTEELEHVNANWSKELAKDAISNLFLRYDGRIEAIIANNDAMAIGALKHFKSMDIIQVINQNMFQWLKLTRYQKLGS